MVLVKFHIIIDQSVFVIVLYIEKVLRHFNNSRRDYYSSHNPGDRAGHLSAQKKKQRMRDEI